MAFPCSRYWKVDLRDEIDDINTKQEFIDSLAETRPQIEAFVASLSPEQLSVPHDAGGWTVKDHLAHLAAWQNGMTVLLQYESRFDAMGVSMELGMAGAYDQMNDIIFKLHKDKSLDTVLAMFHGAHARFMKTIDTLTDEQLHRTYSHYQPDEPGEDSGEPILNWAVGNSSHHFMEHLPWMQQIVAASSAAAEAR